MLEEIKQFINNVSVHFSNPPTSFDKGVQFALNEVSKFIETLENKKLNENHKTRSTS